MKWYDVLNALCVYVAFWLGIFHGWTPVVFVAGFYFGVRFVQCVRGRCNMPEKESGLRDGGDLRRLEEEEG